VTELSFVTPARNEAAHIATLIQSIRTHVPAGCSHEIIVVDNASSDATAMIARNLGARVLEVADGHIGALRNRGASVARGRVLAFLDADIELTPGWGRRLPEVLAELAHDHRRITGSHTRPPHDGSWIERYWFANLRRGRRVARYLGSAHMIMQRSWFQELGGFDETLTTGEDYDLCTRARMAGGTVVDDAALDAIHHGFPGRLSDFIRREAWHGSSDWADWRSIRQSRVALATLGFAGLHVAMLALLLPGPFRDIGVAAILMVAGLVTGSAMMRFRGCGPHTVLINAAVFYFYYAGRLLGAMRRIQRLCPGPATSTS